MKRELCERLVNLYKSKYTSPLKKLTHTYTNRSINTNIWNVMLTRRGAISLLMSLCGISHCNSEKISKSVFQIYVVISLYGPCIGCKCLHFVCDNNVIKLSCLLSSLLD